MHRPGNTIGNRAVARDAHDQCALVLQKSHVKFLSISSLAGE
jgi:hypothetical protein